MNNGGSLRPGLWPPVTRLSPGLSLDASVGVQSLAPTVLRVSDRTSLAALPAVSIRHTSCVPPFGQANACTPSPSMATESATPSAGDSPRLHGRAVRIANDQAATPPVGCSVEVVV